MSASSNSDLFLLNHSHGKGRVRVARVHRQADGTQSIVEYNAMIRLESKAEASFLTGDNRAVIATDTIKNTVYVVAKKSQTKSPENFALEIVDHFIRTYPGLVTGVKVDIEEKPWTRISMNGKPHKHGFSIGSTAKHVAQVYGNEKGLREVISGVRDLAVLKTTQSAWADFHRDQYRTLPDAHERILATSVSADWTYVTKDVDYKATYHKVLEAFSEAFFGPVDKGVFSPGVQLTQYEMGQAALHKVSALAEIKIVLPNLHFIPVNPVTTKFEHDVYWPTDEPHGTIQCTVSRKSLYKKPAMVTGLLRSKL
eukprot:TRINITY_DN6083_c0_g1_i1.p2 TRINITY_DN6083_c0_g1~~TRINITY_DN6083_c0_g1_i1.p2  ORF type:complete len:311 (+),score=121.09 TRINITY_DN6083_c0_g1_i1:77-1009(+)